MSTEPANPDWALRRRREQACAGITLARGTTATHSAQEANLSKSFDDVFEDDIMQPLSHLLESTIRDQGGRVSAAPRRSAAAGGGAGAVAARRTPRQHLSATSTPAGTPCCSSESCLQRGQAGLHPRLHCVPNPSVFEADGLRIGISAVDVLMDLTKTGAPCASLVATDCIRDVAWAAGRSAGATVAARAGAAQVCPARVSHGTTCCSFYPLYPPGKDVNLDMTKHRGLEIQDELDVLVTPSVCAPFIKVRPRARRPHNRSAGRGRLRGCEPVAPDQDRCRLVA